MAPREPVSPEDEGGETPCFAHLLAGDAAAGPLTSVGHGAVTADEFVALVTGAGLRLVVDVRRYPGSRRHPHFGREPMEAWLADAGVDYCWLPSLGGRRSTTAESPNTGLRNLQFRGYADHMRSAEFGDGIRSLLDLGSARPAAVMCSESVWWRCHRRLLADHLVLVEGVDVEHLMHDGRRSPHPLTPGVRRDGDHVVYEPEQPTLDL